MDVLLQRCIPTGWLLDPMFEHPPYLSGRRSNLKALKDMLYPPGGELPEISGVKDWPFSFIVVRVYVCE